MVKTKIDILLFYHIKKNNLRVELKSQKKRSIWGQVYIFERLNKEKKFNIT